LGTPSELSKATLDRVEFFNFKRVGEDARPVL